MSVEDAKAALEALRERRKALVAELAEIDAVLGTSSKPRRGRPRGTKNGAGMTATLVGVLTDQPMTTREVAMAVGVPTANAASLLRNAHASSNRYANLRTKKLDGGWMGLRLWWVEEAA